MQSNRGYIETTSERSRKKDRSSQPAVRRRTAGLRFRHCGTRRVRDRYLNRNIKSYQSHIEFDDIEDIYYFPLLLNRTNILCVEVKALTKRLEQKMRALERELEENRSDMQRQERELQKELDKLRSNHSKIESEKVLKEKEVIEIRDEVTAIRNQITQVIIFLS